MKQRIPPFFFPTTVVFVDDSRDFLANLSLQLDSRLAFRLFESPVDALVAINGSPAPESIIERYFSPYRHRDELSQYQHVINLDLDKIHREVYNECRFQQVSVVVVDYDMPELNGLEFCASIRDRTIKKVLLTGKADERIAVKAFNEGIIDRFIMKQDFDAAEQLNTAVAELKQAYFLQMEAMLTDALAVGSHRFLRDPEFTRRFEELTTRLDIVEHYLYTNPEGILMLDSAATPYLLVVQTEEHLFTQYEIAYDQGAPDELLAALRSNQFVPYFWKSGGTYSEDCGDWADCIYPAEEFKGAQWCSFAVIKNPPGICLHTVMSYNEFLEELDLEVRKGAAG